MKSAKKYILVDPSQQVNQFRTPEPAKTLTPLDVTIRQILENDSLSDDVKAKLYAQTLTRYKAKTTEDELVFPESEVLDSVPINVRHKAKRILKELDSNPDVSIGKKGEFVYRQHPIENSSVVELIDDVLRSKRPTGSLPPKGWEEFAESIRNLDKYYVPNPKIWNVISKKTTVPVTASTTSKRSKRRRSARSQPLQIDWDDDV